MPEPVDHHCQVEVDGGAYIIGGYDGRYHGHVYKLEYESAEWVAVNSMDAARDDHCCAVLDGQIYAMGGDGAGRSTVEMYDPASDTWTYGPVLPTYVSRYNQAFAYGGTVYVIGGPDNTDVYGYTPGPGAEWETLPGVYIPPAQGSDRPIFPAPVVTTETLYCVHSG